MSSARSAIKTWYLVHKWSSLICMVFLIMLCATGLPLIFHEEIDQWTRAPQLSHQHPSDARAKLEQVVQQAKAEKPGWSLIFLIMDKEHPIIKVVLGPSMKAGESDAHIISFDARSGERIAAPPPNEGVMYFILDLHASLLMGLPGTLFLGFMGVVFVVSVVSGIVVYAPFMRKLPFSTVRKQRGPRLKWLDIHNLTGIITVIWVLVVGISGIILTMVTPITAVWQRDQLAAIAAPYRGLPAVENPVSVDRVLETVYREVPDADVSFVSWPGSPFATAHHYTVALRGDTPLTERLITVAMVDAESAELTTLEKTPWYLTAVNLSVPLHFGDYGSLPLKIIWALLDIVAIVVLGSGIYLWLARSSVRSDKRTEKVALSLDEVNQ
ncbi:MAG TPA: PepSY-associated TM helix domain-containing protein [Cellvibrio sp.]|nr:PepSY-associated TM helix domain-containing protein [Cellvibrio sp.]